jgi:hypothetical protein
LETIRKNYHSSQSVGSKTHEMSGQGMQHFPTKIKKAHSKVLGVYCTVGNTGCNPKGQEEKADLGLKKKGKAMVQHIGEKN